MFLKPKDVSTIIIDIITFIKNNVSDDNCINSANMLMEPSNAPSINLIIFAFRFKISDTEIKSKKSKKKFNTIIKSTYILN